MTRFLIRFFTACFLLAAPPAFAQTAKAIFAGGCFWCMESEFEGKEGVLSVVSGYTGGHVENPTYKQVTAGDTGHVEAVEVTYNPGQISYEELLDIFWSNVDPMDAAGQFCDKGSQYVAGIFYSEEWQKTAAEKSLAQAEKKLGQKVATFIRPTVTFYPAEDYHQDYYKTNELQYKLYRSGCGRDARLQELHAK